MLGLNIVPPTTHEEEKRESDGWHPINFYTTDSRKLRYERVLQPAIPVLLSSRAACAHALNVNA